MKGNIAAAYDQVVEIYILRDSGVKGVLRKHFGLSEEGRVGLESDESFKSASSSEKTSCLLRIELRGKEDDGDYPESDSICSPGACIF